MAGKDTIRFFHLLQSERGSAVAVNMILHVTQGKTPCLNLAIIAVQVTGRQISQQAGYMYHMPGVRVCASLETGCQASQSPVQQTHWDQCGVDHNTAVCVHCVQYSGQLYANCLCGIMKPKYDKYLQIAIPNVVVHDHIFTPIQELEASSEWTEQRRGYFIFKLEIFSLNRDWHSFNVCYA